MKQKTLFDDYLTLEDAKELIKNREHINEEKENGNTPLFNVSNVDLAKLFIDHGANVNHSDCYNRTPIFDASNLEIAKLLIENHAELNLFDFYGLTPLNTVNHASSTDTVKLLIENGANPNITNIFGLTLLDQWPDSRTLQTIINYGAISGRIGTYQNYRHLFTDEQQKAFDSFLLLTNDHNEFYQMCLAYQNDIKNHVKIEIKEIEII